MTSRSGLLPFVLGLSLVPCMSRSAEQLHPAAPPTPTARTYTNEDLERVRPFRDELGARSVPAEPVPDREAAAAPRRGAGASERSTEHGEAYWRREAEKLRERLRRLADQREALRASLAERRDEERRAMRRGRSSRSSGTGRDRALEARIAAVERHMRDLEEDLADRARQAGALPGWLR